MPVSLAPCLSNFRTNYPQAKSPLDVAAVALIGALRRQVAMTTRCSACFPLE